MNERAGNRFDFILLFLTNFFFFMCYSSLYLISDHLDNLGASKTYIGFFMNTNSLLLVLFVLFFNQFSSIMDRKKSLMTGFFIHIIISFLMFRFHSSLLILMILKMLLSISFVFGFTMLFSLAYDIIPPQKRTSGVALYGISGMATNPVGTYLGEYINSHWGAEYLFLFSLLCAIIALLLIFTLRNDSIASVKVNTQSGNHSFVSILFNKTLMPYSFFALVMGGAFAIYISFLPKLTKELFNQANLSRFLLTFSLVGILSRLVLLRYFDKLTRKTLISFSLIFMFSAMSLVIFIKKLWMLAILGMFYGISHAILFPTLSAAFVNLVSDDERTASNNAYIAINTFGSIFFSSILGFAGDLFKVQTIFILMAIVIFITFVVSMVIPGLRVLQQKDSDR